MNTLFGMAATTLAFRNLLRKAMPGNTEVTTLTPSQAEPFTAHESIVSRINLSLWRIYPSAFMKNWMPTRLSPSSKGTPTRPALPLDLHYIVTAYGTANPADEHSAERLLGAVLKAVYDHPILTSEEMAAALEEKPTPPFSVEAKIVTESLSSADLSTLFIASRAALRPALPYVITLTGS
jgi:hypothetical protein